jgi:hypothetical protein
LLYYIKLFLFYLNCCFEMSLGTKRQAQEAHLCRFATRLNFGHDDRWLRRRKRAGAACALNRFIKSAHYQVLNPR